MDNFPESTDLQNNQLPTLSRDDFLDIYTRFQKDLFRMSIDEDNVEKAVNSILLDQNIKIHNIGGFKVTALRYRQPQDIAKALKYFFQAASRLSIPLLYVLKKEAGKIDIWFGCISEGASTEEITRFNATKEVLPSILPGFLPGTTCQEYPAGILDDEIKRMQKTYKHRRIVFGVPNEQKDSQKNAKGTDEESKENTENSLFGIERVLDAVDADFMITGYSEPVSNEEIMKNQAIFSATHDFFHLLSKQTEQASYSLQNGTSENKTESEGGGSSEPGISTTTRTGDNILDSLGKMWTRWTKGGEYSSKSATSNTPGNTKNWNKQNSFGSSMAETSSNSLSVEKTNELARQTENLLTRQMKRLEKGLACGMWRHTTQIAANQNVTAERVANILQGYWGGDNSTLAQIRAVKIKDDLIEKIPIFKLGTWQLQCIPDSPFGEQYSGISTLLTSDELVITAPLPMHEIPGLVVEKLTDYGRNFSSSNETQQVEIGKLIDHEIQTKQEIKIDFKQLQRHTFVTGVTGSGKSTTMRHLLLNLAKEGKPFLVIEPIKREYRELKKDIPELQIITLGTSDCNISLSPFDVEPELGLIPHIDNLKAAFNASMGNYSSMPFILEDMIYRAYQECGWDLTTGTSSIKKKMDAAGFIAHTIPVMGDLLPLVSTSINSFFPNQSDYGNSLLGAIQARISSMTRGAKGNVLNSLNNAIVMDDLLSKPCVIELWPFTDNEEKAFIMALILIKLYEYRQRQDIISAGHGNRSLEHILVIEEAHRLLSKPQGGGEHSSNGRQKAVEFFADILAEIRSYGQGIVVVDQIPSKLIPDVMKNTDVKIAHRLADKEDRDILGSTMNLTPEQMKDLARLSPGEAIVYFGGLRQAMKIKVDLTSKTEIAIKEKNDRRFLD